MTDFVLDYQRPERVGFGEAIFCAGKTAAQIDAIVAEAAGRSGLLLTRLAADVHATLQTRHLLDYDALSRTAFLGRAEKMPSAPCEIAIVTAGTSDLPVAQEAARTLQFNNIAPLVIADVGVAGLWRLLSRIDEIRRIPVVIVVAGMDAALPTVLGGLVPGCVIAVPTSVGYGVATGGRTALDAMLASCAPGIVVVNIDNGYGSACAALRVARVAADKLPRWGRKTDCAVTGGCGSRCP
jgi:NCAIR mutase (PurE)-related protein